ncbi:MAG: hypothetical protein HXX12_08865 [Geothrix sp.]|uniref:hypothetical protein n=1 Tax=Geothrix sp. TaxID=1962974 RepID=UPI0017FCE142|nr:hypothetical protein [Geothrix sp.]NWJ41065.1 hypothetical protein [Geothrix sp.]WIL20943.1 MAG: hypothetical protein QOZ81_000178 [Geothrix sp.]
MPGRLLLALPLALLLACGGGSHPSPPPRAARIVYTPPTSGTYQLLLNTEKSTATHLVLDLMGPTGTAGRGVAFHLVAPPGQMTWAKVDSKDAELTQSPTFGVVAGSVLKAKATSGDLQVGAFLTWAFTPSVTFDRTVSLATVALDLVPETAPGAATLRSTSGSAVMLPATLGADPVPITITAGTVTLQ